MHYLTLQIRSTNALLYVSLRMYSSDTARCDQLSDLLAWSPLHYRARRLELLLILMIVGRFRRVRIRHMLAKVISSAQCYCHVCLTRSRFRFETSLIDLFVIFAIFVIFKKSVTVLVCSRISHTDL